MEDPSATGSEDAFYGLFEHSLDPKGRVILPSRFREPFKQGAFLVKADGCLAMWGPIEFQRRKAEMLERSEPSARRSWAAATWSVKPDEQGRITIPQELRDHARLERDVVITGAINCVELWEPTAWQQVDAEGSQLILSGRDIRHD